MQARELRTNAAARRAAAAVRLMEPRCAVQPVCAAGARAAPENGICSDISTAGLRTRVPLRRAAPPPRAAEPRNTRAACRVAARVYVPWRQYLLKD